MNRTSIEQSLNGLLPTLNGALPPELVEIALSLLAQSRSFAHSLKPDEEIARPYACAQLACERLKKRLNLPSLTPHPPCPPRIYKKLYKYLESTLPATANRSEPQTPRKNRTPSAPASAHTTPKTPRSAAPNVRNTPRSTMHRRNENLHSTDEAPEWVMHAIRTTLKEFCYPSAAPHIYTGVVSILPLLARMSAADDNGESPSKRPRRTHVSASTSSGGVSETRTLGLVAVLLFYVLSRMMDTDITPEQFVEWRDKAITTLLTSSVAVDMGISEADVGVEIDALMPMAQEEGWLRMEWFSNVTLQSGEDMEGVEVVAEKKKKSMGLNVSASRYIGLGTMMQDATDYLGERQREDYKEWKARIIKRVEKIEAS